MLEKRARSHKEMDRPTIQLNRSRERFLDWLIDRGDYVFAFCLYIVLTILFTWPLAENFTTFVNGNIQDVFHELWYLHLGSTGTYGPFFLFSTPLSYYPTGAPLYFQVLSPFNTLNFMWMSPILGEIVSYNILYMFTFFFAGFTTYVFVKYLTKNNYAAFLAGLAFAFAPIHTGQGFAHLNIMSVEFLPLFAYFMVKMAREQNMWNSVYVGIALVLNAMCDLHMFLLATTMLAIYVVYTFLTQRKLIANKGYIHRFIVFGAFSAVTLFAVYFQTIYGLLFVPQSIGSSSSVTRFISAKSADLVSFFIPSSDNPFLSRYFASINTQIGKVAQVPNISGTAYVGYSVLALGLLGLVFFWKRKDLYFWGVLALVGAWLALGPYIQVDGVLTPIPGLWGYLYYVIPLLNSFRAPYRFDYLVAFGLAVLAGYGVKGIMEKLSSIKIPNATKNLMKVLVIFILCTLVIVEFLPIPYAEYNAQIPQYYQVLANDHSNYSVIEVPLQKSFSVYLYYQSEYNKPLIDGSIPRDPQYPSTLQQSTPFINELGFYAPGKAPPGIINQTFPLMTLAPYLLEQYQVKYIIVHKNLFSNSTGYLPYVQLLSAVLGQPAYQDSTIVAYKFDPPASNVSGVIQFLQTYNNISTISFLYGNWFKYGLFGAGTQAMSGFGGLDVFSATNQYVQLEFSVDGVGSTYPLQLTVNGQTIATYMAFKGVYTTYTTPFFQVKAGENQVLFYSPNGCAVPITPTARNVVKPRANLNFCVTADFQWIDPIAAHTTVQS
jgi:hypothetical protein